MDLASRCTTFHEICLEIATRGKRASKLATTYLLKKPSLVILLWCALLLQGPLAAQVQNSTLTGRVIDPSGAVVANAAVTATHASTGLVLRGLSNSEGNYILPQLQPGAYSVVVEAAGFKRTQASITLTVGQTAQLDINVPVGKNTELVDVTANNSAQLETQTSALDYTVGIRQVDQLPLNGRNPYALAALSPGIAPGGFFGQGVSTTRGAVVAAATNNFEANGGIGGSNEVLLDGVSIVVCCQGQPAVTPSVEVVSQFQVLTSNPPAEYGHTSGGILSILTKSGSNELHGDIYEFFRNNVLDAANFFTKRSGVYPFPGHADYRLPHRFNQFGGFVGGPVILPHLYNGHDKTFFTFGYEGTKNFSAVYQTTTVPTTLMRQGIFTEAPALIYSPTSYNPVTGLRAPVPAACSGATCYTAGQYIPTIDPVAQKILPLIPLPNAAGVANNYNYAQNQVTSENQYSFRLDHNFSASQRTFIRGTRDVNRYTASDLFNRNDGPNASGQNLAAYLFALGHVWTVSPSLLLQFSYGFARQANFASSGDLNFRAQDYGLSSVFASQQQLVGLPNFFFTGMQTLGPGGGINRFAHHVHSLNSTAIWQRSSHALTIGYNGKMVLENNSGLFNPWGILTYSPTFTNGPGPNAAVPSGQSSFDGWASFLLGYPGSGSIVRQDLTAFNQFYNALFAQDDWRVKRNFTLNIGVRWDIETGFKERHNLWSDFDPSATNPLSAYTNLSFAGGAQYLGAPGNPGRTWPTKYDKVGPRIGFSYSPKDSFVVRGGYGILYLPTSERGYANGTMGFSQTSNMLTTLDGFTAIGSTSNPFPSGVLLPAGAASGVTVSTGSSVSAYVYDNPVSYQQQWNVGIEQDLKNRMVFNLNYAGGHGVKLPLSWRPNDLNPKYFGAPGDLGQVSNLQAQVSNPFYGSSSVTPGTILSQPTVQRAQLIAAFPQYAANTSMQNSSLTYLYDDKGSASYNAMQASITVNQTNGLTGSVAYTWSKLIGNVSDLTTGFLNGTGNPGVQNFNLLRQYERSILATDVPHRVIGNLTYSLPIGKGKRFGGNMPTWTNAIAGGWILTGIVAIQSGAPLGLTQSGGQAFSGSRPTYVAGVTALTSGSTHQRLGGVGQTQAYLNPAAFRLSQAFELGNVPRSAGALRSPLTFQDDVSVLKYFPIFENLRGEFRLEAFNVLNKVQFGLPNTTVGSSSFGYITSQANLPRNVQAALKIHF